MMLEELVDDAAEGGILRKRDHRLPHDILDFHGLLKPPLPLRERVGVRGRDIHAVSILGLYLFIAVSIPFVTHTATASAALTMRLSRICSASCSKSSSTNFAGSWPG